MNVVCTVRGRRMTGMYPVCHRYKRGESNVSRIVLGHDGRTEVGLSEKLERDLRSFIRDKERRARNRGRRSAQSL